MTQKYLITGVAGFIGSNLLEALLMKGEKVIGLDNFSTGSKKNLNGVSEIVGKKWDNFEFLESDLNEDLTMHYDALFKDVDCIIHLAALGSVPRSINNPINTNESNISGFLNILDFARKSEIKQFIYASSSSVYGDNESLPKIEDDIGKPLSPYALTKQVNEMYAKVFYDVYSYSTIGLRFFNVFGPRQNPDGDYAAVIPRWLKAMINNEDIYIYGDGKTTRDFCYIENVIEIILSAASVDFDGFEIFNVAVGEQTSLEEIANSMKKEIASYGVNYNKDFHYVDFRKGDVRASLADISRAQKMLGYHPKVKCLDGIKKYVQSIYNDN